MLKRAPDRATIVVMRTTVDLDEDVLQAAQDIATSQGITVGAVLSELARRTLGLSRPVMVRNGVPLLPRRPADATRPDMNLVNELRDDDF